MASAFVIAMSLSALTAAVAVPCALVLVFRGNGARRQAGAYGRLATAQRFQAIFGDEAPATARLMISEAVGDIQPDPNVPVWRTPAPVGAGFGSILGQSA